MATKVLSDDPVIAAIQKVFQRFHACPGGSQSVYIEGLFGSDDPVALLAGELATEVYAEIGRRAVARGKVFIGPIADPLGGP